MATTDLTILLKLKDQATAGLKKAQNESKGLGNMMGTVLKAGATAGGVALLGAGTASVKMAIDFEKSMAEVRTLLPDISEEAFGKMRDDVLDFSKEMGIATDKAVPALYQAISAGVPKENAMEFMTVASKAAIGGVTELETAVDGITSVINAYGVENISAAKAADIMFTGVRLGKTTFDELSTSLFNVVPIAAASGVSFEQVTAALAALTAQGVPTAVAATQLRAAIQALSAPTIRQKAIMEELGLEFSAARLEQIGLSAAFKEAVDATGGNMEQLRKLIGSVEGLQAVLALGGDQAYKFDEALVATGDSAEAVDAAFNTMEETTSRKLTKAINNIKVVMTELGLKALPVLTKALEEGSEALGVWWKEHGPAVKEFAEDFISFLDDAREVITPFVETSVEGLQEIYDLFSTFASWIYENKPLMIAAIAAVGVAIVAAMGPASAAYAAILGAIWAVGKLKEVLGLADDATQFEQVTEGSIKFATSLDDVYRKAEGTGHRLTNIGGNIASLTRQLAETGSPFERYSNRFNEIRQRVLDANKVIPPLTKEVGDLGDEFEDTGSSAGGAGDAFRGLSGDLANLRQEMHGVATPGLERINTLIQAEEAYLARLAPALADATQEHDRLKDMLGKVEDQISDATDEMKEWEDAVLKGTRAFSDAAQALDTDMNRVKSAVSKIELGMLEEGLEDGGYASDALSYKVKQLGGTFDINFHRGKVSVAKIEEVLAAAGNELDILSAKADVVDLEEKVKLGPKQYELEKYFQDLGGYAEYSFREIIDGADEAALKLAALTVEQNDFNLSILQQGKLVAFFTGLQENHEELLGRLQAQYANLGSLAEGIDPAIKAIWETEGGAVISSIEEAFAAIDRGQTGAAETAMANAIGLFDEIKKTVADIYPGAESVLAPIGALLREVEGTVEIDIAEVGKLLSGDLSTISSDLGGVNRSVADLEGTVEYRLLDVFHSLENNVVFLLGLIRNYTGFLYDIHLDTAEIAAGIGAGAAVPRLQAGGYITRGGLAMLHAGETVTPASGGSARPVENHYHFEGPVLGDRYAAQKFADMLSPYFMRRGEVR